jgi:hypothetical protein
MIQHSSQVGTLDGGYVCNLPFPRVPRLQSTSIMTSKTGIQDTCYSQVPRVSTWSNLTRLLAGTGRTRNGEKNAPISSYVVDVGINRLEQPFVYQLMQPKILDILRQSHPQVCAQLQ